VQPPRKTVNGGAFLEKGSGGDAGKPERGHSLAIGFLRPELRHH
jgi:hypothetical protein